MKKLIKQAPLWAIAIATAVVVLIQIPFAKEALATVTASGVEYYGDTTNPGTPKAITFTNPGTYSAEVALDASEASNIVHLVAKTAPTRSEIMFGHLNVTGTLWIARCSNITTDCNAAADVAPEWNNPGTTATQDCDSGPTTGTCEQAFDIGYEALSGQAFVAYGDNVADKFYYARWDGSAWAPDSSPGTPSATNEVGLPGTGGTPEWIRVIPAGDNLGDSRSNRAIVLVSDTDSDLYAFYWDGSSFDAGTELSTTLGLCDRARCFDGAWQGNNTFVATYSNSGSNEVRYNTYTVGTGWGSDAQAYTTASAAMWITAASDPTSTRIYVSNAAQGEDARAAVWRSDDATNGWTVCGSGGCPDTSTETVAGNISFPAFERFNGEVFHTWLEAGTNATAADYWAYTPPSTWSASTTLGFTASDDSMQIKAVPSPNDDDVMVMTNNVDCDADARMWNGSALQTISSDFELVMSNTNNSCANTVPVEGMGVGFAWDFAWKIYTPWQRNWRWFNGTDLAQTPTTGLAAQNTVATDIADGADLRLRMNYAERGNVHANTDARKKLQYTSGCDPNSTLETGCTWTDVDDIGGAGVWRYVNLACTPLDSCEDGTATVASAGLTGTGTCVASTGDGCGTWVLDKDAAAGASMDHNAAAVQESEWIIEPNGASGSTTYYFRIYDVQQDTPMYREQDASDCGSGSTDPCTYPSLTTATSTVPLDTELMRHGRWFNSAGELQGFFWAD